MKPSPSLAASTAERNRLQSRLKAVERQLGAAVDALAKARRARVSVPPPRRFPKLKGDLVEVIVSDIHGNKHEPAALAAFLADLAVIKPDRVFLGGDILDCGGFLAEHHTLGYVAETADSYEEDVAATNLILSKIQHESGDAECHYLEGNHEWRVERWAVTQRLAHHKDIELLRRTFAAEHVLELKRRRITYYRQGELHGDCRVPGWVKLGKLFYVHKLSNARDAAGAALGKTAANVVFFDTHRAAFAPRHLPGVGLISAWNPGCLCRRQPLWMNTNPTGWNHGYLVRFISRTGLFQMVNVSIENGVSFGGSMFHR
jgi:hypothetical protein